MINPQLLMELLDNHAPALELYAAQWADNPDDVVQVAFIRLAQQVPRPTNAVAWLYKVVRNAAISSARSRERRKRHEAAAAEDHQSWFESNPDNCIDAETATRLLRNLADNDREIVVARIWGGLTFDEIGDLVGVSPSTAHRRYESALEELRRKINDDERMAVMLK